MSCSDLLSLCAFGSFNKIDEILRQGCDINVRGGNGYTAFETLVFNENIDIQHLEHFLKYSPIIANGRIITECLTHGLYDKAFFLAEHGNGDFRDISYTEAFYESLAEQDYDIGKELLEKGINLNFDINTDSIKKSISMYLVENDPEGNEFLQYLLTELDVSLLEYDYDDFTFLYKLLNIWDEDPKDYIQLLIDRGVRVDEKSLIYVCNNGNTELLQIIINNVDENILNPPIGSESSPLSKAVRFCYADIVDILTERGANVNFRDSYNNSIIGILLQSRNDVGLKIPILDRLLHYDIDLNIVDDDERTPIFYSNNSEILSKLLLYGANINHQDYQGHTLLYHAVAMLRYDLVKILLSFSPSTVEIYDLLENLESYDAILPRYVMERPEYFYDSSLSTENLRCLRKCSIYLIKEALLKYGI